MLKSADTKKRKFTERIRMTAELLAYYGEISKLGVKNPKATFEEILKKVLPNGMPGHPKPEALKAKYKRAYALAHTPDGSQP